MIATKQEKEIEILNESLNHNRYNYENQTIRLPDFHVITLKDFPKKPQGKDTSYSNHGMIRNGNNIPLLQKKINQSFKNSVYKNAHNFDNALYLQGRGTFKNASMT